MRWVRGLGWVIGIGLFGWILSQQDLPSLKGLLARFQWRFAPILLFYAVIFGLDTLGWKFALSHPSRSRIRWDRLFRARLAGEAVNYVTPAASIGGEPVKALLLQRREGVPLADGVASVVVAKTTFAAAMILFILTGLAVAARGGPMPDALSRWVGVILPVLLVLMALFLAVQFVRPFSRGLALFKRLAPGRFTGWTGKIEAWDRLILEFYRDSPRALASSVFFHFLGWMAGVVEVYMILRFLGVAVSWSTAWTIEALWVCLKSGAFMIPAGLGANEGFAILICAASGIQAIPALGLSLVRRVRELVWMGLGLVEFARD
ncbi:MAG: flippase-like domain-containing protein [Candidatus Omnitrophica bacterium]|nr:flippase-like domain-containing protein [Candidatus Omnitrophota bacterium]